MPWVWLFFAGLLEIVWAAALKCSNGLSKPLFSLVAVSGMAASVCFLALALKKLPLGTAYAVWTGIGTPGTAVFGILFLDESFDMARMGCIANLCRYWRLEMAGKGGMMAARAYLLTAGVLEVVWAVAMKVSQGLTRKIPAVVMVSGLVSSFYFLALSLEYLPLGTAYAIWTGMGTLGTAISV